MSEMRRREIEPLLSRTVWRNGGRREATWRCVGKLEDALPLGCV